MYFKSASMDEKEKSSLDVANEDKRILTPLQILKKKIGVTGKKISLVGSQECQSSTAQ